MHNSTINKLEVKPHPELCVVKTCIDSEELLALVDNGSQVSLIHEEVVKRLGFAKHINYKTSPAKSWCDEGVSIDIVYIDTFTNIILCAILYRF